MVTQAKAIRIDVPVVLKNLLGNPAQRFSPRRLLESRALSTGTVAWTA
jgi:hypothetical protein